VRPSAHAPRGGQRVNLVPDVGLFLEHLGQRAYPALVVRMEPARILMSEGDLQAISERVATPVLRVEARARHSTRAK